MLFQDTLLIIKPDYMHKRRPVLLKVLASGYQIQGSRKLNFSPELAAEFYADFADEKGFMLEVILLSKGISEAFILTKENGVQDLLNIMMCYFGTASELERNIHVTKHVDSVAREITFIFPNYIHEPIEIFDKNRFCNRPMLKPLLSEIYDIMQNVDCSQEDWKVRVSDYLMRSNPVVPQITNQCQLMPDLCMQEKSQQTTVTYKSTAKDAKPKDKVSSTTSVLSSSSPHSSLLITTSSCVTCGGFDHTEPCTEDIDLTKRVEPQSDEPVCVDEEIIWKEIVVYEEVVPEEEQSEQKDFADVFGEDEFGMLEQGSSSLSDCKPAAPSPQPEEADAGAGEPDGGPAEEAPPAPEPAPPAAEAAPPAPEEAPPAPEAPPPAAEEAPPEAEAAEEAPPAADEPPPEAEG
ncbi:putative surface protein SACOL0050 [Drosophila mojavensis]|uniref:Nucleoside diphosphate kinase-like domain-containing protein n=1 Tax=Drosophila mojavensis TaxID=7230 RepID=B4K9F3_DROMO|nr:putative surface protein SACOL0050 [Drosophila mojavensis]EDW16613.1 uncharacterized protein Dmoj_GI10624 [Drosophila mojavensis]